MSLMISDSDVFRLIELLRNRGLRISFAESCTGGMAAEILTSIPGVSDVFLGSAVTYSNESKEAILGVSHDTILNYGAVSECCAKEMAIGSLKAYGSDISVAVTGIAGPDGATPEKPIGLVFIAATDGKDFITSINRFYGDRKEIRLNSVYAMFRDALSLIAGI